MDLLRDFNAENSALKAATKGRTTSNPAWRFLLLSVRSVNSIRFVIH